LISYRTDGLSTISHTINKIKSNRWLINYSVIYIKIVKSKWVYSIKNDPENKTKRFKARLVAAGFNQVKYRDYEESYSPVVNIEAWRTLLSIAAQLNMRVCFYDKKTAYLYGSIDEIVYIEYHLRDLRT